MKKVICEKSYRDGNLILARYYKDETKQELHREDGPAYVENNIDGTKNYEEYYINGVLHREDGPAKIMYYINGNIEREEYYKNGILHREDGPAKIIYYGNGNIDTEEYYINGVFIPGRLLRN